MHITHTYQLSRKKRAKKVTAARCHGPGGIWNEGVYLLGGLGGWLVAKARGGRGKYEERDGDDGKCTHEGVDKGARWVGEEVGARKMGGKDFVVTGCGYQRNE